jgi:2-iminobutanoate/2-iminopropanoate deaminase
MKMISTVKAPAAIGPYSQGIAVAAGETLFLSGQLGLDPISGELAAGGIEGQTRQALKNVAAILEEAGMGKEDVVKTTIFLADLGAFQVVNRIYGEFFGDHRPARSTVEVSGLPRGGVIEIETMAVRASKGDRQGR